MNPSASISIDLYVPRILRIYIRKMICSFLTHLNILNFHVPSEKAIIYSIFFGTTSISKCRIPNKILCH